MPTTPARPSVLVKQNWTDSDIATTAHSSDTNPHTQHHNDLATNLNTAYAPSVLALYDFSVDPGLGYYALTQPTGHESFTPTLVGGRLRYTGDAGITDVNHRIMAPSGKLGHLGDSEVFSEWHALDQSLAAASSNRQMGHSHRVTHDQQVRKIGVATSAASSTISDSTAPFVASEFIGNIGGQKNYYVTIIAGTGLGQTRRIVANTTTALTVDSAWSTAPNTSSYYKVWSYNVRGVVWAWDILFTRGIFHCYVWEGTAQISLGNVDLTAYLQPSGTYVELPWYVKTRLLGRQAQVAVWKGTDAESDYTTSGRSGSFTLPAGFDQSGESGLYVGHLDVGQWMEFKNLIVRRI